MNSVLDKKIVQIFGRMLICYIASEPTGADQLQET